MKIYLTSSWWNPYQQVVLGQLRAAAFEVYDFNKTRTVDRLRNVISHPLPVCVEFPYDANAMKWADACVLLLPPGIGAYLEAGWFAGAGKPVAILDPEISEATRQCFHRAGVEAWPLFRTVEGLTVHLRELR